MIVFDGAYLLSVRGITKMQAFPSKKERKKKDASFVLSKEKKNASCYICENVSYHRAFFLI